MAGKIDEIIADTYDHEKLIQDNKDNLIDKIDIKTTLLLDKMEAKGALKAGDVAEIREEKPRQQIRDLLERVRKGDRAMFVKFLQALEETGQGHINERFLIPAPKEDVPDGLESLSPPAEEPGEKEAISSKERIKSN